MVVNFLYNSLLNKSSIYPEIFVFIFLMSSKVFECGPTNGSFADTDPNALENVYYCGVQEGLSRQTNAAAISRNMSISKVLTIFMLILIYFNSVPSSIWTYSAHWHRYLASLIETNVFEISCLLCMSFCCITLCVIIWCKDNKLIVYLSITGYCDLDYKSND